MTHDFPTQGRLLAKVVRELLAAESFVCLADLTEALKVRLARLHIRWATDDIHAALRLIASNRPLIVVASDSTVAPSRVEWAAPTDADAVRVYRELLARYAEEHATTRAEPPTPRPPCFPDLVRVWP